VEFDVNDKYYKPAGYGNPDASHYEYIEYGRKPWQYRNAGSAIIPNDEHLKYPRICAHRGFNTIAPENSMPAFGAAIALGAHEIEFDLWPTSDGEIVSCHDSTLDRVSDGSGKIYEHTYEELKKLDFGVKFGEKFKGLQIVLFEEILKKFSGHTIMNVHVKPMGPSYNPEIMKKIVALVRKYDASKHIYFMLEPDSDIRMFKEYAPDINICVGHDFNRNWAIVDRAIELGAQKVQFFKPYFNKEMIDKAHAHGIICNIFWADDPEEAKRYLEMGIDTILTNDYNLVSQILRKE
jgi:glycerophosphoryl diester phosphodiesterase